MKKALTLAHDELKHIKTWCLRSIGIGLVNENVLSKIEEALAQTEQEPVATDWERIARVQNAKLMAMCNEAGGFEKLCEVMDKYEQTNPPQRTWVGLTFAEICECESEYANVFARNLEAKLKEKNT